MRRIQMKVKHLVIFGPQSLTEYYTSQALMLNGFPAQKYADKVSRLSLLAKGDWQRLIFALAPSRCRLPLRAIRLWFPNIASYKALEEGLEGVMWHEEEVEVKTNG